MELSKSAEKQIIKSLKKRNKHIWKDNIILGVITKINKLRKGELFKKDWYIPDIITYEDWLYQLNLTKYLNGNTNETTYTDSS